MSSNTIPSPPSMFDPSEQSYTGPYCVSVTEREYCVNAVLSCLSERRGEERFKHVTEEWHNFAEGLIAFYGEAFWNKELAPYIDNRNNDNPSTTHLPKMPTPTSLLSQSLKRAASASVEPQPFTHLPKKSISPFASKNLSES